MTATVSFASSGMLREESRPNTREEIRGNRGPEKLTGQLSSQCGHVIKGQFIGFRTAPWQTQQTTIIGTTICTVVNGHRYSRPGHWAATDCATGFGGTPRQCPRVILYDNVRLVAIWPDSGEIMVIIIASAPL